MHAADRYEVQYKVRKIARTVAFVTPVHAAVSEKGIT